mgnify:CR=1 FL=1
MKEIRKIRVVGCQNCPYYEEFVDGSLPLDEQNLICSCAHPTFKNRIAINEMPCVGYIPDWCPLEIEAYMCSSN